MQYSIEVSTSRREELVDITDKVAEAVNKSGVVYGFAHVFVQGATAGIMIQENWDDSIQNDVIALLKKYIPQGIWEHDRQDGNGDAHLKSGLVGPSETVPVINGRLGLGRWQNIFLCEFDGPRSTRHIVFTLSGT
ncbi:MAG: secondary thiamine-phosphate synthase enzyme YjbQ [Spirochaetaceae bacterium]